jgi:hypothetical protein
MSFLDNAIGNMGHALAKTATDSIAQSTGVDAGGTLGYLFGNNQEQGGVDMAALGVAIAEKFAGQQQQLTLLQAELYQQGQALISLGNQITGIANALTKITGMIQNLQQMLIKIGQEQLYQEWQAVDNQMTVYIAAIDTAFSTYGNYISTYKTTPTIEVKGLITDILNVNVGPKVGLRAIHDFMMGGGQQRGSLQLWSNMVAPLVRRGVLDYRLAVQQYFAYYQKLTYAQLRAANLLMEAYNFHKDGHNAKNAWEQYKTQLLAQENEFITWLTPLIYGGVQGGVFAPDGSTFKATNYTAYDAAMQLNPGVQYVRGDGDVDDAFYAPSDIYTSAEQLLASLAVTSPTDRRIVVHMLYPKGAGINTLLDGLKLTLSPVQASKTIHSISASRLGSPYAFPTPEDYDPRFPDQNIYTGSGFYLKRYVFSSTEGGELKDGQYTLTDLNGHDGLVPIQTYLSSERGGGATPFQRHSVVSHPLRVNAANPFDFMNFAAYTVPSLLPG